jgi:glycerophosphoryl diester phosphodiesterase
MIRIAHRGYSSIYGDNTIRSFQEAIVCGQFDMIEMDIQVDHRGTIVIHHNLIVDESTDYLTFETFIRSVQVPPTMKVYLDLKGSIEIVSALEDFFWTHPTLDVSQFIVCSFNLKHLRSFTMSFVKGFITCNSFHGDDLDIILDDSIKYFVVDYEMLDHDTIEYCHSRGIQVLTYTPDTMDYVKRFKVDGVIVNGL